MIRTYSHSNGFTLDNLQPKNIIVEKSIRFTNLNIVILFYSFSLNTCDSLVYQQLQKHYNQHQNHKHNLLVQSFLIFQSFEIFPKHKGYAEISESFALNLIISVPLTNK